MGIQDAEGWPSLQIATDGFADMQQQTQTQHRNPPPQHISAHEVLWCQILIEGDIWSVKHPAEKKASQETSKKQGCPELWASQRLVA